MSHAFNIMDARGAIGVTERAACFSKLRQLSRQIAQLWVERREEIGHPLGTVSDKGDPSLLSDQGPLPSSPADFVLEIGVEELPPDEVDNALEQLRAAVPAALQAARLKHGAVEVDGTPRRLLVIVKVRREGALAQHVWGRSMEAFWWRRGGCPLLSRSFVVRRISLRRRKT